MQIATNEPPADAEAAVQPAAAADGGPPKAPLSPEEIARLGKLEPTSKVFTNPNVPTSGSERTAALMNPANWTPARQALHEALLDKAVKDCQAFADAAQKGEPTVFAMRGNTAAGKTRAVKSSVPELAEPLAKLAKLEPEVIHKTINPDDFKVQLARATDAPVNSGQVHEESSILAKKLEQRVRDIKTSDGKETGSLLIDKRLGTPESVEEYAALAKGTGREFKLCDVDAPFENSLIGVLERRPNDGSPLPHYGIVSEGFEESRGNRAAVVKHFQDHPELAKYELFGTTPQGTQVKVAEVVSGRLVVHDQAQFDSITLDPADDPSFSAKRNELITHERIERAVANLPNDRAQKVRGVLQKHMGKTWDQALKQHSLKAIG